MDAAVQRLYGCPVLALHGFRHERCGSGRDRASLALEADVLDAIFLQAHPHGQPIAAERVVPLGMGVGGLDPAEVPRALVVVENDVPVEILQVHYANTSRALSSAATRLATSACVL